MSPCHERLDELFRSLYTKATYAPEDYETLYAIYLIFEEALEEWNLENPVTGEPCPTTVMGMRQQEREFMLAIIGSWVVAISGVYDPLPQPSEDGKRLAEDSIPMETK